MRRALSRLENVGKVSAGLRRRFIGIVIIVIGKGTPSI
jgi:hypothetical protein